MGGESEDRDLHMKMKGLNLQTTVSPARDSAQRYSELIEYSTFCKPFMKLIGKPAIGEKNKEVIFVFFYSIFLIFTFLFIYF